MKLRVIPMALGALVLTGACALAQEPAAEEPAAEEQVSMESFVERSSYAIGMNFAETLQQNQVELSPEALIQGVSDALAGGDTLMTETEVRDTLQELQETMQSKQTQMMEAQSAANQEAGAAFLAANAEKEGIVVLPSGLQYQVLTEGDGPMPAATDTVRVHYHGTLIDGTVFDSSVDRGEPAVFPVNRVIPGWVEAIQLMPVGSKWQLFIPSNLAYAERGAPPKIGPHAVLVFEVELLGIEQQ